MPPESERGPSPESVGAAARGALERTLRYLADFLARVWQKGGADDVFFLGGGIAFNFLLAAIPFLLLLISLFAYFLEASVPDPRGAAINYVISILPASDVLVEFTGALVDQVVGQRRRFGILGLLLLVWVSTRLIGSLRAALRSVFDVQEERGILQGKIFDMGMVIVAGSLFVANTAISVALEAVQSYGVELLGLTEAGEMLAVQAMIARILAYAFIFLMFVLVYRYLPARRIPWRIAVVAGTFTSIAFEILKSVFAWWVANFATYESAYGTFATAVVLVFWIYYSSVVFVIGGEVGQVYELYRIRSRQRELLD
jgi:membrane protein